jgi:acetolactate decarboxylase
MRQKVRLVGLALVLVASVALGQDRDCLFQVSTLDALLAGVYDRAISVGELRQHGDTGLGCFEALDGEMVVLDGKAYQVRADGSVHRRGDSAGSPFAAVTFLDHDSEVRVDQPLDLKGLSALAEGRLPGRNLFCVLRLDGEFSYVKTRSVPRQHKPYPKLADVAAKQPTFEFEHVTGTLVGLYCPYFVAGANLPDFHWHFLNAARTGGGHLLACNLTRGTLWLDPTPRYQLSLPSSPAFLGVGTAAPDTAGAQQVEQDRH